MVWRVPRVRGPVRRVLDSRAAWEAAFVLPLRWASPRPPRRRHGRPFAPAPALDRMSDDDDIPIEPRDPTTPIPFATPKRRFRRDGQGRRRKPRVRKLRLFWILLGLGALAVVSTVFGM